MERRKTSDSPRGPLDIVRENLHGHIDRQSTSTARGGSPWVR